MTRASVFNHPRSATIATIATNASSLPWLLGLLFFATAGCTIADEDRCGEGYVYQQPGCFPLRDASDANAITDGTDDDGGDGSKTCMQISLCKQDCADAACRETCAVDGCQSAKESATALETCSQQRCAVECEDPSAAECASCSQRECGAQVSACLGNTCS